MKTQTKIKVLPHIAVYDFILNNPGACKACVAENFDFCVMPALDELLDQGRITVTDQGLFNVVTTASGHSAKRIKETVIKIVDDDYKPLKFSSTSDYIRSSMMNSAMEGHLERGDKSVPEPLSSKTQFFKDSLIQLDSRDYDLVNQIRDSFLKVHGVELSNTQVVKRALWLSVAAITDMK